MSFTVICNYLKFMETEDLRMVLLLLSNFFLRMEAWLETAKPQNLGNGQLPSLDQRFVPRPSHSA